MHTHSHHIILTVFPQQQRLHERASMLRYSILSVCQTTPSYANFICNNKPQTYSHTFYRFKYKREFALFWYNQLTLLYCAIKIPFVSHTERCPSPLQKPNRHNCLMTYTARTYDTTHTLSLSLSLTHTHTHRQPHCVCRTRPIAVLHKLVHTVTAVDTRQYVASPYTLNTECSFSTPLQFTD
jgi:hypothetical protein